MDKQNFPNKTPTDDSRTKTLTLSTKVGEKSIILIFVVVGQRGV